jgi:hypothetical protein
MSVEYYRSVANSLGFGCNLLGSFRPLARSTTSPAWPIDTPVVKPHAWNLSIVIVRFPPTRSATTTRSQRLCCRSANRHTNRPVPPRVLWDRRWHPSRAERRPAVPPIKVRRRPGSSLSPSAGRRCLWPGTPCLPTSSRALIKRIYTGARGALLPLVCLGQRRFRR